GLTSDPNNPTSPVKGEHRAQGTPNRSAQTTVTGLGGHCSPRYDAPSADGSPTWNCAHRRRARCEDRCAEDTGLRNLPCTATPRTRSGGHASELLRLGSGICPYLQGLQMGTKRLRLRRSPCRAHCSYSA